MHANGRAIAFVHMNVYFCMRTRVGASVYKHDTLKGTWPNSRIFKLVARIEIIMFRHRYFINT